MLKLWIVFKIIFYYPSTRSDVFDKLRELHGLQDAPSTVYDDRNTMSTARAPSSSQKNSASSSQPTVKKVVDKRTLHENARAKYKSFQKDLAEHPESLPGLLVPKASGIMLGSMLVENLGKVDPLDRAHHSKRYIYPRGFRAKMMLPVPGSESLKATMSISSVIIEFIAHCCLFCFCVQIFVKVYR